MPPLSSIFYISQISKHIEFLGHFFRRFFPLPHLLPSKIHNVHINLLPDCFLPAPIKKFLGIPSLIIPRSRNSIILFHILSPYIPGAGTEKRSLRNLQIAKARLAKAAGSDHLSPLKQNQCIPAGAIYHGSPVTSWYRIQITIRQNVFIRMFPAAFIYLTDRHTIIFRLYISNIHYTITFLYLNFIIIMLNFVGKFKMVFLPLMLPVRSCFYLLLLIL